MAYVNVFIEAWNEHRHISVGGRASNNEGGVRINTAHQNGESAIKVKAEVVGRTDFKSRRKHGDNRESHFTVELPEPDPAVKVHIVEHGHALSQLARMGAALCMVKGVIEAETNPTHSRECLRFGIETLAELEADIGKHIPDVELPGGIGLARALACVRVVEQMEKGEPGN